MNNEILKSVDELVSFIKESDDYKEYIYLKDKLSHNEKANTLIKEIKKLQKELVKKESNNIDVKELDKSINDKLNELKKIPLYNDFINKQEELNDLYQLIKNRLDNYFYNKLN